MTQNQEPTNVEKLRGLPWSIASNAANTVFVQFTFFGSVFVLFLSALGLSKGEMGFLLSLLPFTGVIAPFVAPAVERYGYRRVYLTFFGTRNVVAALLLLTPWVLGAFGREAALLFVAAIVASFSVLRSIGMTASVPWIQEYVPNAVRGKYTATNNVFTTLSGFLAVMMAGAVLGRASGLFGYTFLIGTGVILGLVSVWLASFIPGGAPSTREEPQTAKRRDIREAIRDRPFLLYLAGVGLFTLATVPLGSFLPLFMQEEVGLNTGGVVWLQIGSLAGALLASPLWGWAADRYGSKPVMLMGIFLRLILPLFWMAMPRGSAASLPVAMGTFFLQGFADMGWGIGSARLLYVSVVPPAKRSDYLALYNAWTGIAGGASQLIGGVVLEASQGISGQLILWTLDPYFPLFLMGLLLPVAGALFFRQIRIESDVSVGEFAGIFLRGNPFLAMTSLVRYHLARSEQSTLRVTAALGQAKSPLAVEELLEALADPRFNVRFEAIQAVAHGAPDERLIAALADVLRGPEPALSVMAAWALGRLGDERAIEPLREGMDANYRSVRAHSSRALATLGDHDSLAALLERLGAESDYGLRVAYASAVGQLSAEEGAGQVLDTLHDSREEVTRLELALALARILGEEHHFIRLLRQVRADLGTTVAQELALVKKKLPGTAPEEATLPPLFDECAAAFAHDEIARGTELLSRLLLDLPRDTLSVTCAAILDECTRRLTQYGAARQEYLLLALHALGVCWGV
ncbi:MAG: MFS transporter [Ardenticatenaceae bacterium]